MLLAITEALQSCKDFDVFNECLCEEDNNQVEQREAELTAWAEDKLLPDPYHVPPSGVYVPFFQYLPP